MKKFLASLLALAMVLSVMPFAVFAEEADPADTYASGLDDGAHIAAIVPDVESAGQKYHWTTGGVGLEVRTVNNERFYVFKNDNGLLESNINASMYDAKNTYGETGVPFSLEGKTAMAIRIRLNDLNPDYTYDSVAFRLFMSIGGQRYMYQASKSAPFYWIEAQTGAVIPFSAAHGWWNNRNLAMKGNADGYLVVPFSFIASKCGVTEAELPAYLEANWSGVQFFFDVNDIVASGDNQRRASVWKNFEFLYGGAYFIEDMEKFANARKYGEVKYDEGDGTQVLATAFPMREYFYGWQAAAANTGRADPASMNNKSSWGYIHTVNLPEGGQAARINAYVNADGTAPGANWGNTNFDAHSGVQNLSGTSYAVTGAVPTELLLNDAEYIAFRAATLGGTQYQHNWIHFYTNATAQKPAATGATFKYIDRVTGKVSDVTNTSNGIEIYGNIDGWYLIPVTAIPDWYNSAVAGTKFGSFQVFLRDDWKDKSFIFGDVRLVTDLDKFYATYAAPSLDATSTDDSITVTAPEANAFYSVDGTNWNTTGVFTNLEKGVLYTLYAKYGENGRVGTAAIQTAAYSTGLADTGVYFSIVPKKEYMMKYGQGLNWASSAFWKNPSNTGYQPDNQYGLAHIPVVEDNGEYFVELVPNPAIYVEGYNGCGNISIGLGNQYFGGGVTAPERDNLTHIAFRVKVEGGKEGQVSKVGIIPNGSYFNNEGLADAYLVDYETREVIDPEWKKDYWTFTGEFNGWVVMPFEAFRGKTLDVKDAEGNDIVVPARDAFLGTFVDETGLVPEGTDTTYSSFQFWFHNDTETNDTVDEATGEVTKGHCSHYTIDSDWVGKTIKIGDVVAIADTDAFNTVRTSCDVLGHELVATETVYPDCENGGYTTYDCTYCDYTEDADFTEATGHTWVGTRFDPTCTEKGYYRYDCACGASFSETLEDPLGHNFESETIVDEKEVTCEEDGYIIRLCDVCGEEVEEIFTAEGHNYETEVTAPAPGKEGYTTYTCTVCGDSFKSDFTPALPEEGEVPTDRVNNVATTPSDVGVTLTWDAFAGAVEYYAKVYAADDTTFSKCLKTITTKDTSAFFDYKLLAYNTNYKFLVTAKYNTNKYLTVANATKVDGAMEVANRVVGHTVKMEGVGAVVDFLPVEGAQEYMVNVFENDANGTRIYNASLGTATSARVMTNLTAGTTYVVMINVKLGGKWTALADLRVNGIGVSFIAPVYNPSNVTIADQTANSIRFNWSNVRGATQYFIRVTEKETGALINTLKAEGKTTATLSRGTDGQRLKANTTYLIQFYTYVNSVTNSGVYGDPIEVTTIDYEDITVTAAENAGKLTATWNKTTNAVGYFVRTYKDGVQIANKYVDGADKTSYSIKVPTEAGAYSFGIIAYEKNTSGAAYTPVSISNEVAIG